MHISDGVLPPPVWIGGLAVTGAALAVSVRRFDDRAIPRVAVFTSFFFVASMIHVPLGGVSVHLLLNGLLGIVLGCLSLPAIAVALFFQNVLLGHGGLTAIGVNTITMGSGALFTQALFSVLRPRGGSPRPTGYAAFFSTAAGVLFSGAVYLSVMGLGGKELAGVAAVTFLPQIAIAFIDGAVTASTVVFLLKVKPEMVRPRPAGGVALLGGAPAAALLLAALAPAPAFAHGLVAVARAGEGGGVRIEAFFTDDTPARGARVTVRSAGAGGSIVAEGTTGPDGGFVFFPTVGVDLVAVIEDAAGHRAVLEIPGGRLAAVPPPDSGARKDDVIARAGGGLLPSVGLWVRVAAGAAAIGLIFAAAAILLRRRGARRAS